MKRSSVDVFFFFPLLLLPRVMVVLQFYRDYEVFVGVFFVGGGVGGGVLHSTTVSVKRTFLLCRLKTFDPVFRFLNFVLPPHFILIFFGCVVCVCVC